jgi:zinc-ribbon domain
MAGFCGKCGSSLNDTAAFCVACGARVPAAPTAQAAYTPAPAAYTPAPAAYTPAPAAYTPAPVANPPLPPVASKSNTLVKVVVAFVVIIFVGGALALGGLWYVAQRIKAKAHAVTAQVLGESTTPGPGALGGLLSGASSSDDSAGGFKGDPCRFLSKAEVSQAVGLPVIRTEANDGGCSYIARGDPADVTAKHMSSMIGGLGADAQTQKTIQKFAGAMFAQQEASDKALSAQAATGEIPVLVISFTAGHAALEMKANRAAFQHIGGNATSADGQATAANSATGDLSGIGDEAYVAGGSMIMLRKGNVMARFMYVSCPCNTDNIKPLARTVASRL